MAKEKEKANTKTSKEVQRTDSPNGGVPAKIDFEQDAGAGFEDVGRDDLAIPFIRILQSNSPQCDDDSGKYIKGAKKGMLINNVTNEMFDGDKGIVFIPCQKSQQYVEWLPRDDGGGFMGRHDSDSEVVTKAKANADPNNFGKLKAPNGNDLVQTYYIFGLAVLPDGRVEQANLAFTSTQIKKYKQWITISNNIRRRRADGTSYQPAMYSYRYRLTTVPEENKKGKFYGWRITFAEGEAEKSIMTDPALYEACRQFHDAVSEGKVRPDYASDTRETAGGDDEGDNI